MARVPPAAYPLPAGSAWLLGQPTGCRSMADLVSQRGTQTARHEKHGAVRPTVLHETRIIACCPRLVVISSFQPSAQIAAQFG